MRLRIVLLAGIVIAFAACSSNKNHFTVSGTIANMPVQRIQLRQLSITDSIVIVDSGRSDANGKFELSGDAPQPGLYQLIFEQSKYMLLSIDQGDIKITGTWPNIAGAEVEGPPPTKSLIAFMGGVQKFIDGTSGRYAAIQSAHAQGKDSVVKVILSDINKINQDLTTYVEKYADTTKYLPNALFAVRILNPKAEQTFLQAFSQGLQRRFPGQPQAKDFMDSYNRSIAQDQQQTQQQDGATAGGGMIGKEAPEIIMNNTNGVVKKLSAYRGRYVLLDFWASWCGPCRAENPNVVAAYNKYHGNKFDILGVSLDKDHDAWTKAIDHDGLAWTQVSDLKQWDNAAAVTYGIQSIPANFLIDPTGKIVAQDLRGDELDAKLAELLKN